MVTGVCNNCMQFTDGIFYTSGSTSPLYINAVNEDGLQLSGCVTVTSEVIRTYPEMLEYDECGCPINECEKASIRINIKQNPPSPPDCGFSGFTLDSNGLILFTLYDGTTTNFMDSECCTALGFTPELKSGIYVCVWQTIDMSDCNLYTPIYINVDGQQVFLGPDGNETINVPSRGCCPIDTIPTLDVDSQWICLEGGNRVSQNNSEYSINSYKSDGTVVFTYKGAQVINIPVEYCSQFGLSATTKNGRSICKTTCESYVDIKYGDDGIATFIRYNGAQFNEVSLIECCPLNTIAIPTLNKDGVSVYRCKK